MKPGVVATHQEPGHPPSTGRRAWLAMACGTGAAVLIGGCAGAPKPSRVSGSVQAAAGVNPSVNQRPSPLLVRLYELKSATAFDNADFLALFQREQAELGADLLGREEIMINPGETRPITRTLALETRFIGVFAAYRDLERARWRAVVAVEPGRTYRLLVRAEEFAISAQLSD